MSNALEVTSSNWLRTAGLAGATCKLCLYSELSSSPIEGKWLTLFRSLSLLKVAPFRAEANDMEPYRVSRFISTVKPAPDNGSEFDFEKDSLPPSPHTSRATCPFRL